MTDIIQQFTFSFSITGPICLMLLVGVLLRQLKIIDEHFISVASTLVFKVTLPAMLFLSIAQSTLVSHDSFSLIIFGVVANTLFFIFTTMTTHLLLPETDQQGVIIQGAFRANAGIIGLAYVTNAFGSSSIALSAIYVAAITLLYNVLAVIALTPKATGSKSHIYKAMIKSISRNPLIISILLGLIVLELNIPIPDVIVHTGRSLADITLPLALICTGGSLNIHEIRNDKAANIIASSYRLILSPLMITAGAYFFGFRDLELGIIFFMSSAPTAAASYVMARSMGGNPTLAANIIVLTTILSTITCSLGIMLLSTLHLMA